MQNFCSRFACAFWLKKFSPPLTSKVVWPFFFRFILVYIYLQIIRQYVNRLENFQWWDFSHAHIFSQFYLFEAENSIDNINVSIQTRSRYFLVLMYVLRVCNCAVSQFSNFRCHQANVFSPVILFFFVGVVTKVKF